MKNEPVAWINDENIVAVGECPKDFIHSWKPLYLHPTKTLIDELHITEYELKAFNRFNETCEDGEGYDVPKDMMKRLADIGLVNHLSAGYYRITNFGNKVLGVSIPAKTLTDEEIIKTMVQFDVYSADDQCLIEAGRAILKKASEK